MTDHEPADRSHWERLASAWGLPLEAMPDAFRHLQARLLEECGDLVMTAYELRHDGTERRYYLPKMLSMDARILVATRPANWNPVLEDHALRTMQDIMGERLDFTS